MVDDKDIDDDKDEEDDEDEEDIKCFYVAHGLFEISITKASK